MMAKTQSTADTSGCTRHQSDEPACVECFLARQGEVWQPPAPLVVKGRRGERRVVRDVPRGRQQAAQRFRCARMPGNPTWSGEACAKRHMDAVLLAQLDGKSVKSSRFAPMNLLMGGVCTKVCHECDAGAQRARLLGVTMPQRQRAVLGRALPTVQGRWFEGHDVDWSLPDEENARIYGVATATVRIARQQHGVLRSRPANQGTQWWLDVDWSQTTAAIAERLGKHPSTVRKRRRQMRAEEQRDQRLTPPAQVGLSSEGGS